MIRTHRIVLSVLSGILLSLPWLGLSVFFIFVAFVPLFFLNDYFIKHKIQFALSAFWGHSFLAFLIWNIASAWWMAKVSLTGVGTAMLLSALLMSAVFTLSHSIARRFSKRLGNIAFLAFFITLEYLQFTWDIEWPCLQAGSILANSVQIIQWYEYTGTFGGTLWVLLFNLLVYLTIISVRRKEPLQIRITNALALLVLFVVPLSISLFMYSTYNEKQNPVQIAIVQPNVDPYIEKFDRDAENQKLETFLNLASTVVDNKTELLIGPETLFEHQWMWNEENFSTNEYLQKLTSFISEFKRTELLFGVSSYVVYPNKEEATVTSQNKEGIYYDRYNTALFLNQKGNTQIYHKSKLVSGVEKTPFIRQLPFLKNWILDLGGAAGTLGQQEEAANFVTHDSIVVAPVICFESVFGEYVTNYVKKGAQIIVVITNDGWWKNSRGYKQHLLFSQLRAIETRRSIARAANNGTSCFINQSGNVIRPTSWWEEAAIKGEINVNDKITFYVKHGDYIARGAALLSVFLLLLLFVKRLK